LLYNHHIIIYHKNEEHDKNVIDFFIAKPGDVNDSTYTGVKEMKEYIKEN